MVGDPIADFITRLKNAGAVKKETISIPKSKLKESVANLLKKEGYLKSVITKGKKNRPVLEVGLLYKKDGSPRITNAKRVSKLGKRVYKRVKEIKPVKFGKGILVLSTPNGLMSDKDARKEKVGGEALFEIW